MKKTKITFEIAIEMLSKHTLTTEHRLNMVYNWVRDDRMDCETFKQVVSVVSYGWEVLI